MKKYILLSLVVSLLHVLLVSAYASTLTYQYDDLHRLTQIERSDGTVIAYTYDNLGNRMSKVVTVPPTAPVADFTANPTSGLSPLSVSFTDQSTGEITSWAWDFDNNGSVDSTVHNPTHMYVAPGNYTVSMTVTGPGGSDSITKTSYISATEAAADADNDGIPDNWESVYFSNTTTANSLTDWDKDGYTDLQEYLNQLNSESDPEGALYDPKTVNVPGGTGYVEGDSAFWNLMLPAILSNVKEK